MAGMQKVSLSFPIQTVTAIDEARGEVSRNQFVLRLLAGALGELRKQSLHRLTAEVYAEEAFAAEEEQLAEQFFAASPEAALCRRRAGNRPAARSTSVSSIRPEGQRRPARAQR